MNLLLKDNKFGFTKFSAYCPCAGGGGGGGGCSATQTVTSGTRVWVKSYQNPSPTGGGQTPPRPAPLSCQIVDNSTGQVIVTPPMAWDAVGTVRISNLRYTVAPQDLYGTENIPPKIEGDPTCQPICTCATGGGGCRHSSSSKPDTRITTEQSDILVTLEYTLSQDWVWEVYSTVNGGTTCRNSITTVINVREVIRVDATKTNYDSLIIVTNTVTCTC